MHFASVMKSTQRTISYGTSGSGGTTVTANASTTAKGSWAQLVAATDFECQGVWVCANSFNANGEYAIDIGIGASSAEIVKIPDILFSAVSSSGGGMIYFPISIATGARVSARALASNASATAQVSVILVAGRSQFQRCDALGVSNSNGTDVDPGASSNTKGAYAQVISATGRRYHGLGVAIGNRTITTRPGGRLMVDIARGTAGSEKIIIPDLRAHGAVSRLMAPLHFFWPCDVPEGQRLAARAASEDSASGTRHIDVALYGVC